MSWDFLPHPPSILDMISLISSIRYKSTRLTILNKKKEMCTYWVISSDFKFEELKRKQEKRTGFASNNFEKEGPRNHLQPSSFSVFLQSRDKILRNSYLYLDKNIGSCNWSEPLLYFFYCWNQIIISLNSLENQRKEDLREESTKPHN